MPFIPAFQAEAERSLLSPGQPGLHSETLWTYPEVEELFLLHTHMPNH